MVPHTSIGKYSYGPICRNHIMIERIGAFCSFASGVEVVQNHAMDYITTHPMIFHQSPNDPVSYTDYKNMKDEPWFFEGIEPVGVVPKSKRITIGNDVWLGKNVIVVNGSNIGNGVIAGAGSIITKDIPDYAIVAGNPARIIRYRYNEKQIEALNKIEWWNWSDEEIRCRYEDFYLPIDSFIEKYL